LLDATLQDLTLDFSLHGIKLKTGLPTRFERKVSDVIEAGTDETKDLHVF